MSKNWAPGQVRDVVGGNPTIYHVPLETPKGGEWREARITVPKKWALAEPHTNDFLRGKQYISQHVVKYIEWLDGKGYEIIPGTWRRLSGPDPVPIGQHVRTPTPVDFGDAMLHEEQVMFTYLFKARLTRTKHVKLSDHEVAVQDAETFGVDFDREVLPWNRIKADETGTKDFIDAPEGGDDPMKVAEERRQKLGLKREDFLVGPLGEPRWPSE